MTESKEAAETVGHSVFMTPNGRVPPIPTAVGLALRPIPTAILEYALNQSTRSIALRHLSMFVRLGDHAGKRLVLDPTDLSFLIAITLDPGDPFVSIMWSSADLAADAYIAGQIGALLGLVPGRYDGDALFFSGDLTVEGDIAAILALRNALDDLEIDMLHEGAAMLGLLSGAVERVARPAASLLERYTGLALTRSCPIPP